MADILHMEPLISAITSGPKIIYFFGKLEKLENQLVYSAIKISSKTVKILSFNLTSKSLEPYLTMSIYRYVLAIEKLSKYK